MKCIEFDEDNPIYRSINSEISNDEYLYNFIRWWSPKYNSLMYSIDRVRKCNFNNYWDVVSILNKKNFGSKEYELNVLNDSFNKVEKDIFTWLDSIDNPYKHILHPLYEYNVINGIYGYRLNDGSGLNNVDMAINYAKYKVNGKK